MHFFYQRDCVYRFLLVSIFGEGRDYRGRRKFWQVWTISRSVGRSIDCVNSGAATHCRLIFERLAYTRLVLKKFITRDCGAREKRERERQRRRGEGGKRRIGDHVDKAADVIREIQGPSISDENERGQLNIGLTKNTTTLVRHSRSCHSLSTNH